MKKTAVTFLLINTDGKILMQQRDDGNGEKIQYPNMWCIPGGVVEAGEEYIDTVIREVKEEYDLDVTADDCRHIAVHNHDDVVGDNVFACRIGNKKPKLQEGKNMAWMNLEQIEKLDLAWHQNELVVLLKDAIV